MRSVQKVWFYLLSMVVLSLTYANAGCGGKADKFYCKKGQCINYCYKLNKEDLLKKMLSIAKKYNQFCFVNRLTEPNITQIATGLSTKPSMLMPSINTERIRLAFGHQRCYNKKTDLDLALLKSIPDADWSGVDQFDNNILDQYVLDIGGPQALGSGWDYTLLTTIEPSKVAPSNWISSLFEKKSNIALRKMCIPGTHDSGTGALMQTSFPNSYKTQKYKVLGQLERGSRYLDLRVLKLENEWITHHGGEIGESVNNIITSINQFLTTNKKEVILIKLDLKTVSSKNQIDFYKYFIEKLGNKMLPFTQSAGANTTLKNIWEKEKNIIVISKQIDDSESWKENDKIWGFSNINDQWPNVGTTPRLQQELKLFATGFKGNSETNYDPSENKFWIPQIVLTPFNSAANKTDVRALTKRIYKGSMVDYVDKIAKSTKKFEGKKPGINIALVDYYADDKNTQLKVDGTFDACMNINKSLK